MMPKPLTYVLTRSDGSLQSNRKHTPYYLLLALMGFWLLPAAIGHAQTKEALSFETESRIWVEGTSTIHDWSCEAEVLTGRLTLAGKAERPLTSITSASVTVPVEQFECGKDKMNRKLREAFQAEDYPDITFTARTVTTREASLGSGPAQPLVAEGQLSMAGTTQAIEVRLEGYAPAEDRLKFTGQHRLDMTDYAMEPPTAMWGAIKTDEQVTVHFEIWARHKK